MNTAFTSVTWEEAVKGFLLHLTATNRSAKTVRFYKALVSGLAQWANKESILLDRFGKRYLDAYLAARVGAGVAKTTLHSDAICAKAFLKWCASNDLVDRSPLAEYAVRKAPRPFKYKPTDDDMKRLMGAVRTFWEPSHNAEVRFLAADKRSFHRDKGIGPNHREAQHQL